MIDRFEEILKNLSKMVDINLHLDEMGACSLIIDENIEVQMELTKEEDRLLIACFIEKIPPGKFREKVLEKALMENNKQKKDFYFAFDPETNKLVIFRYFPIKDIDHEIVFNYLTLFVETAKNYQNQIQTSQLK